MQRDPVHTAVGIIMRSAGEAKEQEARIRELEAENARLREALQREATKLDTEATYWVPGSAIAGRNPYAPQMHNAFTKVAERLRSAAAHKGDVCPELKAIFAESNRDTDYTPI